ncbi:MAG: DMP19 family protein [Acidobacteria bacterium]|nr:DMP19 family protein [Acidobacteriota bacterium]
MTDAEYLEQCNDDYWRTLEKSGVDGLSRLQRDALCIMNLQAELNNGGLHQYLINSSGDLAGETPAVLRRIGADDAAALLDRANAYFGPDGPPVDRDSRMGQLLALPEGRQQEIHDLTDEFFDAEDRGLSLADLFDAYVLSQRPT